MEDPDTATRLEPKPAMVLKTVEDSDSVVRRHPEIQCLLVFLKELDVLLAPGMSNEWEHLLAQGQELLPGGWPYHSGYRPVTVLGEVVMVINS